MKYLLVLNIFFVFWSKFNRIAEINALKEEAGTCYQNMDFEKSIFLYEKLLQEYKETDESVRLNLGHSYFHLKRYNSAVESYRQLTQSRDLVLKSDAYLQLGVIYSSNNKKEIGLNYFKEALKASPQNEAARYNYELLKKEQEAQKELSTDKKRENSKGENQTSATESEESRKTDGGGGNPGEEELPPVEEEDSGDSSEETTGGEDESELNHAGDQETDALISQRLREVNINERQARMILKTMKSSEVQYVQQKHRIVHPQTGQKKPDW